MIVPVEDAAAAWRALARAVVDSGGRLAGRRAIETHRVLLGIPAPWLAFEKLELAPRLEPGLSEVAARWLAEVATQTRQRLRTDPDDETSTLPFVWLDEERSLDEPCPLVLDDPGDGSVWMPMAPATRELMGRVVWEDRQPDGTWDAGSGAVWDLRSNDLHPDTWTSADAAGLPDEFVVAGLTVIVTADTVFDVARRNGMTTAFVSGKQKLQHIVQPDDVDLCSIKRRSDSAVMEEALGHLDDAVQVHLPLARQAAHEVELHSREPVLERPTTTLVEIVVGDLLADLPTHVVASLSRGALADERLGRGRIELRRDGRGVRRFNRGHAGVDGRPDAAILEMKELGDNVFYGG